MERTTANPLHSPQPFGMPPTMIHIYPWQRLEDQPVAALLSLTPRLCFAFAVQRKRGQLPIATSRSYYLVTFGNRAKLRASDNLVDLLGLIDGQRTIQTISTLLAEQQGRPVHPAEIVYVLRSRLIAAGLAELQVAQASPAPRQTIARSLTLSEKSIHTRQPTGLVRSPGPPLLDDADTLSAPRQPEHVRQTTPHASIQWIPEASRANRLRTRRMQSPLSQRTHRASFFSLIATLLVVLAAGAAFAYGQTNFSHASFTPPNLNSLFGQVGPTTVVQQHITPTPQRPLLPIHYVVQERDTLQKIAAHFHVTVKALLLVNHLSSPNDIQPDLVLIIPSVYRPGANVNMLAHPIFYIVQAGDNLYSISQLFSTPYDKIIQLNRITNPTLIHPGDDLVIP